MKIRFEIANKNIFNEDFFEVNVCFEEDLLFVMCIPFQSLIFEAYDVFYQNTHELIQSGDEYFFVLCLNTEKKLTGISKEHAYILYANGNFKNNLRLTPEEEFELKMKY